MATALAAGTLVAAPALALPGDADPSFGGNGTVITDTGTSEGARDLAIQPDGKIVTAGHIGSPAANFFAARHNADGSPDLGFDGDGWTQRGFGADERAIGVAVQNGDSPVLAGWTDAGGSPDNLALALFDGAGSGAGSLITDAGASERAQAVVLQPNGRIVVAASSSANNFVLTRYSAAGVLDASFDNDGIRSIGFGGQERSLAIAVQPDGKLVAVGFADTGGPGDNFALARLNANGSLDATFDGDGRVRTDFGAGDRAFAVALQPDGKIVAAGVTGIGPNPDNFALARYLPDGSLDESFGGDGRVVTDFGLIESASDVAIQPDGKIAVTEAGDDLKVVRYLPDGEVDTGFAGDGRAEHDLGVGGFERAIALAIQADGKIVAAGDTNVGPNPPNQILVRYEGGDPPGPGDPPPPDGDGDDGTGDDGDGANEPPTCRGRKATIVAEPGAVTKGTRKADVIVGTPKGDKIKASRGRDRICSGRGKDKVNAGPGGDQVAGGGGRDRLAGGRGNDLLKGMKGNDVLRGGPGRDRLAGGKGKRDRCIGGPGKDRVRTC